jgi:hypothetical protein
MAQIIPLQLRARAAQSVSAHTESAEILLFLGVRYVRMEEPSRLSGAPKPRNEDSGGKRRKRRARG